MGKEVRRRKPRAYKCEYEGKKYLDVTEFWLETSSIMPELDKETLDLMKRKKVER